MVFVNNGILQVLQENAVMIMNIIKRYTSLKLFIFN